MSRSGRPEQRWNPLLGEWVLVAPRRFRRPLLPGSCPFCPGGEEVPGPYDVLSIPNRFPSLVPEAAGPATHPIRAPEREGPSLSAHPVHLGGRGDPLRGKGGAHSLRLPSQEGARERSSRSPPPKGKHEGREARGGRSVARGACEVILYTPDHNGSLGGLPVERIARVVEAWRERTRALSALPFVRQVFPFENRGRENGVTLDHPHGQIYALPFVPPVLRAEAAGLRAHRRATGRCLLCDLRESEPRVFRRGGWTAYVPSFARWTHEVHLVPDEHIPDLPALRDPRPLASALKALLQKYDRLFGRPMPLMMAVHQAPNGVQAFHLHVEFYPALESGARVKYRGGLETGAGTWTRTSLPEACARELRKA